MILPDTTSSARYVDFDLPYLTQAFTAAGYATTDFKIDNAAGRRRHRAVASPRPTSPPAPRSCSWTRSTAPSASQIQACAAAAGVTMISYDRATFQGTNTYYVSFDNVQVGKLIGQGFMDCLTAWGVTSPKVFTLDGGQDTDPNAIDFAKGYNDVVWGQTGRPGRGRRDQHRRARRSSASRSPPAGTTPRAARSSSRPSPPTRRSTPRSRPTTVSPAR